MVSAVFLSLFSQSKMCLKEPFLWYRTKLKTTTHTSFRVGGEGGCSSSSSHAVVEGKNSVILPDKNDSYV